MTVAIFCGSRDWLDPDPIREVMRKLPDGSVIINGAQRGADTIADDIVNEPEFKERGFGTIPIEAEWEAFGLAAGPKRNTKLLQTLLHARDAYAQPIQCYAFHEKISLGKGTRNMVKQCLQAHVRTFIWVPDGECTRVSHLLICKECGRDYLHHPQVISVLDHEGEPFLNWICDGMLVKLLI